MKKEKKNLNKFKIFIDTCMFCIVSILLISGFFMINNSYNMNNNSYSLSTDEIDAIEGDHLRYITENSKNTLSTNSKWNNENKKILDETLDKNINNIQGYKVEGTKEK